MSQPPQPPFSGQPGEPDPTQVDHADPDPSLPYPTQSDLSAYPDPSHPGQAPPTQPFPTQPFPTQPFPTQPNLGQPNLGQPYPAQPPDQGPLYAQSASYSPDQYNRPQHSQTPQYGQDQYGQPTPYGQGQYAPGSPYGPPGYGPGYPPGMAPPVKKKSKVLPIVLSAIAGALVLCVGGAIALAVIGKREIDRKKAAASAASSAPTTHPKQNGGTTEPTTPTSNIKIVQPATLGGRPRLTEKQFAEIAKQLESSLSNIPGETKSVGALYGAPEKQNIVIAVGAAAPIADPEQTLNQIFLGAGIGGLSVKNTTSAGTGSLGGSAECGNASTSELKMAICGWADEGSLGLVIWYSTSVDKAKAEFPQLRAQIEQKS